MFTNLNKSTFNTPQTLHFGFANNSNKTLFGNVNNDASKSGFFGSSESGGFFGKFGQATQQSPFGSTQPMASNNPFQNLFNQNVQPGTVLKYSPLISSDLVQKAGITETVNTKLNCITCMKEYEGKSLEELRFEDYQTGRKCSHSQTPVSEVNPFKPQVPTIQPSFGQNENKNLFGQSLFGQNTTFNISSRPTTSLISKTSTVGASNNNRPFGFGSAVQTSSLSSINNAKPFTTSLTTPTFGTNLLQQNSFNKSNLFDQSNTGGIFRNPHTSLNQSFGNKTALFAPQTNEKLTQNTSFGFPSFGQNTINSTSQSSSKPFSITQTTPSTLTSNSFSNPLASFPQSLSSANVSNSQTLNKSPELTFPNNFNTFTSHSQPKPLLINQPQMQNPKSLEPQKFDASNIMQITSPFGFIDQFKGLAPIIKTDIEESLNIPNKKPKEIPLSVVTKKEETVKFRRSGTKTKKVLDPFDLDALESGSHRADLKSCRKLLILKNKVNAPPKSIHYLLESKEKLPVPVSFLEHISETPHKKETKCEEVSKSLIVEETPEKTEILEIKETPQNKLNETCGVILTRVEYYTIPPLEELHKYSNELGRCIIKGFTIGRTGYGNIHFLEEVDITNLNLDEIVHFRHREVLIYPDDSTKPPFGQGLNRPAQITLDRVWPNDKNKNIITDVKVIVKSNFADKLKQLCESKKVTFKEYRPETGSWVFTIDQL